MAAENATIRLNRVKIAYATYWKVALYGTLILLQAAAAAIVAYSAQSSNRSSPAETAVLLALVVVIAAGARELVRELTGPEHKAGKEVKRASHLLNLLSDSFPSLMARLRAAVTASTPALRVDGFTAVYSEVLTTVSQLIPGERLRVAYFQASPSGFVAHANWLNWGEATPVCPSKRQEMIRLTLEDPLCVKVWSADIARERSVETLAFKVGEECKSLVAAPVRGPEGLSGYLYVESDKTVLEDKAASLIVALAQLIAVSMSLAKKSSA